MDVLGIMLVVGVSTALYIALWKFITRLDGNSRASKALQLKWLGVGILSFFIAAVVYSNRSTEPDKLEFISLMSLTLLPVLPSVIVLAQNNASGISLLFLPFNALSGLACSMLWILYVSLDTLDHVFSLVSLILALGLVVGSIAVLNLISKKQDFRDLNHPHRLSTLFFFFSVFISLTVLLGLCLAFHNRNNKADFEDRTALFASSLYTLPQEVVRDMDSPVAARQTESEPVAKDGNLMRPVLLRFIFVFLRDGAQAANLLADPEELNCINGQRDELESVQAWNANELKHLSDKLRPYAQDGWSFHVEAFGHADSLDVKSGSDIRSNDDLRERRAAAVCNELERGVGGIDGALISCEIQKSGITRSNFKRNRELAMRLASFSVPCHAAPDFGVDAREVLLEVSVNDNERRDQEWARRFLEIREEISKVGTGLRNVEAGIPESVSALLRKKRELYLMDYMYFTIYTITTTGYGDIVPVSAFAKLICSVANLIEILFLVIFFNVLLAEGGERLSNDKVVPANIAGPVSQESPPLAGSGHRVSKVRNRPFLGSRS